MLAGRPTPQDRFSWGRSALWVLVLLGIPSALQGAKLKWKPVRPITQVQLEQSAKPRTALDVYPVKQTVAAQNGDGDNPLADPFEDGRREIESTVNDQLDNLDLKAAASAASDKVETQPASPAGGLDRVEDHFPNLQAPTEAELNEPLLPHREVPPSLDAPNLSNELHSSPYYEAPRQTDSADCSDAKLDCDDALSRLKSNTLANIDLDIAVGGVEGQDFPCGCEFGVGEVFQGRQWNQVTFNWKASGLCHKPLYFEQVAVERYGHSAPTLVQDVLSAAHFFASVPALPYMMGLCPPDECQYSLGYYRPGNCAPYLIDPIPLSLRAGLFQAGAIVGGILIIP